MDNAEAWDDIVQNRLLFYQKLQSAFNRRLDKGKEEEGVTFACQLDDERAHVYYAASKGLMKQGSFQAAKVRQICIFFMFIVKVRYSSTYLH